jgi:hypothetical protein
VVYECFLHIYEKNRTMQPVTRTPIRRKRLSRLLGLVAAALVSVVLVGSMALVFTVLKDNNSTTNVHGSTPTVTTGTATTTPTPAIPTECLDPVDLAEQALCTSHAETMLNLTKTFTTGGNGTWKVTFLRAYADTTGLILLYTVKDAPSSDWISFMSLTIQQGITLHGGGEQGCNAPHARQCQLVMFDTSTIPAGTTKLHVQAITNAFTGNPVPLKFTIPLHTVRKVVAVHKTQTSHGISLTLDHLVLTGSKTLFYFQESPQFNANDTVISSITINGQNQEIQGSISRENGGQAIDLSLLDKPGSWMLQFSLDIFGKTGSHTQVTWTFHFTVTA